MTTARQAIVKIVYNAKDISNDIAPFLLDFSYTDNESGKADDIQITLEDRNQLWIGDWFPAKGDTITASIVVSDWFRQGEAISLPCGTFTVDEIDFSGPPSTVAIKATSIPTTAGIKGQTKTRAWERISLQAIAAEIAAGASLSLMYEADGNPQYLRIDQVESSDLAFLQLLCEQACVALKVTDNKIVIFDKRAYESNDAVRTIDRLAGDVKNYGLKSKTAGTAKTAKVSYSDPLTGETAEGEYTDESQETGTVLEVNTCPNGEYNDSIHSLVDDSSDD